VSALEPSALLARLAATLELVDRNLARVERYFPYWRSLDGLHPQRVGRLEDKIASELALFVMLVHRLPPEFRSTFDAVIEGIAARLEPLVRNQRFQREIATSPEAACVFGLGHIYLTQAGLPDPAWDRLVLPPLRAGFAATKDRPPHQILARLWAAELAGIETDNARWERALSLSIVASRAHPIYMTEDDGYAYTHCLMYAADFGRRPIPAPLAAEAMSVVSAAVSWTLTEPDFDLLAEFLLCQTFLDPPWSAQATVAWRSLCAVWDSLDFVPGPTFDEATFRALEDDARRAYAFKEVYHPNVVAGALCCALLQLADGLVTDARDWTVTSDELLAPALKRLRRLRGVRSGHRAAWELVARENDHSDATAHTLAEAAVLQALRALEFDDAANALRDLERSGYEATRTVREAREHLRRSKVSDDAPNLGP
jgi:hypothetical protein